MHRNPVTRILEPRDDAPLSEETIDIAIIPGRAFTAKGERMGRGNGGYDIWISAQKKRSPSTLYIGVCFDCQIVQELPMETHDEIVDVVVTARGIFQHTKAD